MNDKNTDFLVSSFKSINYDLSELQIEQFIKFYEMLVETNKVMNLTAITEYEDVVIKHFVDSTLALTVTDLTKYNNMIDVGTGAGFPGIPLKILFPHLNITLLDSLNKRINFLKNVVEQIGLSNVTFIHGRAEDIGRDKEHREKYDLCVSRAVANLSTLSEYCTPFVKAGGDFISYKASNSEEEIEKAGSAISKLGCKVSWIKNMQIPDSDIERTFVCINKVKPLSGKYPRKSGVPSRTPL